MKKSFDPFSIISLPKKPYNQYGFAKVITKHNYPNIHGMTVFYVEIFNESMRTIHIHTNCDEIGYVLEGEIQVFIYQTNLQRHIFKVQKGECWFIPKGSLHSLNNIGEKNAKLYVGFNSDDPTNIDLKKLIGETDSNPLFSKLENINVINTGNHTKYLHRPIFWNPISTFSVHEKMFTKKDSHHIFWIKNSDVFYVNLDEKCFIQSLNETIQFNKHNYYFVSIGVPHSFIIKKNTRLLMFYTCKKLDKIYLKNALKLFPNKIIKDCIS